MQHLYKLIRGLAACCCRLKGDIKTRMLACLQVCEPWSKSVWWPSCQSANTIASRENARPEAKPAALRKPRKRGSGPYTPIAALTLIKTLVDN